MPGVFGMLLIVYSCQNNQTPASVVEKETSRLEKAGWLLGRWENNSEQGNLSET